MTLQVTQKIQPRMDAAFEERYARRRETVISEAAYGNCNQLRHLLECIKHGGPAVGAEMESDFSAALSDPDKLSALAVYTYRVPRESRLRTEYAASALLTIVTMTDRNPHRIAIHGRNQIPAGAPRLSFHSLYPPIHGQVFRINRRLAPLEPPVPASETAVSTSTFRPVREGTL